METDTLKQKIKILERVLNTVKLLGKGISMLKILNKSME